MISLVKELELARERVAQLERQAAAERQAELAALPAAYGFASVDDFERALRNESRSPKGRRHPERSKSESASAADSSLKNLDGDTAERAQPVLEPQKGMAKAMRENLAGPATNETNGVAQPDLPVSAAPVAATTEVSPPPPKPLPTGTSLADPANFGLLPDLSLLEQKSGGEQAFRTNLNAAVIFAQQVLHTSRVPAAVWREWRDFVKKAGEALRGAPVVHADL